MRVFALLFLLFGQLFWPVTVLAQSENNNSIALKDSNGIRAVEAEFLLKLSRFAGDKKLEFEIQQSQERHLEIKLTNMSGKNIAVTPIKNGDDWIMDLSPLPNGKYLLLIYDYDANKLAHLLVHKQRVRRKWRSVAA
jgi:hypothetical protein